MKKIFFLAFSLLTLTLNAQTFGELIVNAEMLYQKTEFLESAIAYEKAFQISEGDAGHYYDAACSYALAGDTALAIKYLQLATNKGYNNSIHLKNDEDLQMLHAVEEWQQIVDKAQANLDEYEKDFDKPLKMQLEQIYIRDQMLRQLFKDAENKFGRESGEMNYFWELVAREDSLNELEVIKIIEEKGWVGKSTVGGKANITLWLVIQHAAIETQEKYLPLLRKSVLEGESSARHLALLEDRIQMRKGKPQIYGSQITVDKSSGKQVVYEIVDPELVNQRRAEIGLGPIEDYLKRMGMDYNVD